MDFWQIVGGALDAFGGLGGDDSGSSAQQVIANKQLLLAKNKELAMQHHRSLMGYGSQAAFITKKTPDPMQRSGVKDQAYAHLSHTLANSAGAVAKAGRKVEGTRVAGIKGKYSLLPAEGEAGVKKQIAGPEYYGSMFA